MPLFSILAYVGLIQFKTGLWLEQAACEKDTFFFFDASSGDVDVFLFLVDVSSGDVGVFLLLRVTSFSSLNDVISSLFGSTIGFLFGSRFVPEFPIGFPTRG